MKNKSQKQNEIIQQPSELVSMNKTNKHKKWCYIAGSIAAIIVVFITVYMLILPAITMEGTPICGIEEHIHDDSCYAADDEDMTTPVCGIEEHIHTDYCYPKTRAVSDYVLTDTGDNKTITKIILSYKCPDVASMTDYKEITDDVVLHGNDAMKLELDFENVSINDVKNSNYKLYYLLPEWMQNANGTKTVDLLDENFKPIGTVTTQDGYLVVTYDTTWLDNKSKTATTLVGSVSMEAVFSADHVHSNTLVIGNITIHIDYNQNEWESKYATLNIEKSTAKYIEQDDGYDILQYTLTVSTGDARLNDVQVKDVLTADNKNTSKVETISDYLYEIVGVTQEELTIPDDNDGLIETSNYDSFNHGKISYNNDELLWNIGNMRPQETRTLTYQVKLKKECTGIAYKNALLFQNVASVYSNDIYRDKASSDFKAVAGVYVEKKQMSYTPDPDGIGGTITYYIKVNGNSSNTFTMDNVKIYDFFGDGRTTTLSATDVTVNKDSFRMYDGNATTEERRLALEKAGKELAFGTDDIIIEEEDGKFLSFTCYIGDLAPGQEKTIIYTVSVHDSYYLENNGSFDLANRATIYDDDTKDTITPSPNKGHINAYMVNNTITYSMWDQKYTGTRQGKNATIQMDGNVYKTIGSTLTKVDDVSSFDVKTGNYKYRVIVNQNGDLDVNSVNLNDTLNNYMKYTGYLRVDAYDSLRDVDISSDPGDLSENIIGTAWLDIDDLNTFTFSPAELGFSGSNAYVLTYYTKVTYDGDDLYISTTNSFNMSGTVQGSGGKYILSSSYITVTTQTITSSDCSVEKYSWCYQGPLATDESPWEKGAVYWYIRVSGTEIPATTVLKDQVGSTKHKLVDPDSFVGIYILPSTTTLSSASDLNLNTGEQLDSSLYNVDFSSNGVTIEFPTAVTIPEDDAYYIILKTAVLSKPAYGNHIDYENDLYQKTGDGDYKEVGDTVSYTLTGVQTAKKTLADKVAIFDGKTFYNVDGSVHYHGSVNSYNYINSEGKSVCRLTEPGAYLEYQIDTCLNGSLTGDVVFSDIIPEGLEVAFLRNQWYHGGNPIPTADNVEIEELEEDIKNNPNSKWTRYDEPNKPNSGATSDYCIYYFNSETRELRWKIANAKVTNGGIIDFQLVCKVVDSEVLLGVKTGNYTNSLTVYQNDRIVDQASTGSVTLTRSPINKSVDGSTAGTEIPFKIVVNELSEDLLKDSDTIVLVDELSSDLLLEIPTISVKDKNGNEIKDEIQIAMEKLEDKTVLKFTIPDDQKITITYKVTVNAPPDEEVSISNVAHWEGYEPSPGTEWEDSDYSFSLGAQSSAVGHANLLLTKYDANNIMTTLSGATFTMQEAVRNDDGTFDLIGEIYTGITDNNGEIIFSTSENYWMEYDKIYCLTEIGAPTGYVLDSTPHYILLASKDNDDDYPSDIEVQRNSVQYVFNSLNKPVPSVYRLPETGGIGDYPFIVLGFSFVAIATVGFTIKRKQKPKKSKIK